jgi:hypothetical protein
MYRAKQIKIKIFEMKNGFSEIKRAFKCFLDPSKSYV